MAESNVKLRVDARDAVNALQQTNRASQKLNTTLQTTSKRAGTATANIQRFGISFRSVVGPMVALTGALTLANRSLNTFGKRQADLKVLETQLQRIGAGGSKQLEELRAAADSLGDATLFSQDDFIQSFNILSSFRAIAVESFTEVSSVAADIAQVMGSDVKSATVQLAKALEDPKRGLTALSRSGITFNKAQTETIKKLVDSGKLLDAQALILETIKGQYEGAGKAAGKGFAGALDLLGENAEDAAEALGKGLEPAATTAATALAGVFEQISKIPAPAGQAALQIGLITTGVIALKKAVDAFIATKLAGVIGAQIAMYKAFGAQIYLTAAAQGALNTALGIGKALMIGLPFLAVAGGIIGIADALRQAITGQSDFNKLLKDGTLEMLENELATKKASLALQERMMLQGRGEGRASDRSRLARLQSEVSELEAALLKKRAEEPKKLPKKDEGQDDLTTQGRADASEKLLALNKRLFESAKPLSELEKISLEFQIEKQKILDRNMLPREREIALLRVAARFEESLLDYRKQQLELQQKQIDERAKDFSGQLAHQDELSQLLAQQNDMFAQIGQTIEDGLVRGIEDAITGAKSLGEALSDVLKSVGSMFLKQGISSLVGGIFDGFGGGGGGLGSNLNSKSLFSTDLGLPAFGDIPSGFKFASGGFVDQPTRAVIGEGGESEYVIPSSKMNEAMGRYARGARGGAVIPDGPGGDASGGMAGGGGSIDVSYSVERINNVNYVTAAEFERGMAQAAKRGAELGRRNVYSDLVNKRSVRSRVGV